MKSVMLALFLLPLSPLAAQVVPEPGSPNPRIQTLRWEEDQTFHLTALPATGLTVLFEPGERIASVDANSARVDARVSSERDGLLLIPKFDGELGSMQVTTDRRNYRFTLRTGTDLMAAYLVRFVSASPPAAVSPPMAAMPLAPFPQPHAESAFPSAQTWGYRLKGDREVRPARISDDGVRTTIEFAQGVPLPAVFAIGPAGDEQVVNGYMRNGRFVIDEVWRDLVFRIDSRKASARRNSQADGDRG